MSEKPYKERKEEERKRKQEEADRIRKAREDQKHWEAEVTQWKQDYEKRLAVNSKKLQAAINEHRRELEEDGFDLEEKTIVRNLNLNRHRDVSKKGSDLHATIQVPAFIITVGYKGYSTYPDVHLFFAIAVGIGMTRIGELTVKDGGKYFVSAENGVFEYRDRQRTWEALTTNNLREVVSEMLETCARRAEDALKAKRQKKSRGATIVAWCAMAIVGVAMCFYLFR